MREDRLRALRAIRFAARFEFEIEPATWSAVVASVPDLEQLSVERITQEIEKTMEQVRRPSLAFRRWRESGALATLIPALASLDDTTIASLDCLPLPVGPRKEARKANRLAALFLTAKGDSGLSLKKQLTKWIEALADSWSALGAHVTADPTPVEIRRWVSRIGRLNTDPFFRIAAARWTVSETFPPAAIRSLYGRAVRAAFRSPVEIGDLAINGNDIIAAGIPPGPHIRQILDRLLQIVLADPESNRHDVLMAQVRHSVLPR
jgi:tRNA nucleotidyltransferase (CCA-adding enzyme)